MPNPATALDPETLKAALLSRGMLADRGRYTPFAGDAGSVADGSVSGTPVSLQSAVAGNAAAGVGSPSTTPAAANNDNTQLPIDDKTLNKMSENDATGLLVALGITGATALAAYLARRRKTLATPTEDVPLVEGENIGVAQKGVKPDGSPIDGVYTEVPDKQIGDTKQIGQSAATVPDNQGMKALGAPKEVDVPRLAKGSDVSGSTNASRRTLAQTIADRARKGQPNDVPPIPVTDSYADLTPAELNQAETLMEQMRRNRKSGNAANVRRVVGDRTVRSTAPTGSVSRDSLFNTVVDMIRKGRVKPQSLARVVP